MNLQRIWMTLVLAWGVPAVVIGQFSPVGPEFQVNTYTTGYQYLFFRPSAVASDAAGDFVVVWISYGQDGSAGGVFGQRYSNTGTRLGSELQVNTYTTGHQAFPAVASDAAGNFVAVWGSDGQDGSSRGVFGQRYASTGAKLGSEFQVNTYTTGDQLIPVVASDAAGNFVVVWESGGQDGSDFGVFGQRFTNTGARLGTEFQVNTYTTGDQGYYGQAVASDAAGNFVVVWESRGQDGSDFGVFGQRYASTGAKLGSEFQVNTYTTDAQALPAVASDAAGNFVVVWDGGYGGGQDGSGRGVFGQRYSTTGARLGTEFQVNTYTTGPQDNPAVASDAAGNFVAVWGSLGQDGSSSGVFGQRYSNTGARLGIEFQVNTYTTNSQGYEGGKIASGPAGSLVVVWASHGGQDGDRDGIFAQRFTTSICDTAPKTGCKKPTQSQTSVLQLKNNATDTRDSLSWTWPKGEATATADFGDPLTTTSYSFCVYDESAGTPSLVLSATAPAAATCGTKPCWKATGTTGFKYADAKLINGGLKTITLKAGAAGAAKITVKGKGVNLGMPPLPLAQDTTVTAQLVNSDGVCWEAQYSTPAIKNLSDQFKDKGD